MATSPVSTTGPLFQAGGLASGLDTTSIVNSIITADSAAMLQVQKQQAAYSVQISTLATLYIIPVMMVLMVTPGFAMDTALRMENSI